MKQSGTVLTRAANRRMFLRNGMIAAGAAGIGAGVLPGSLSAFERDDDDESPITKGDIAILRFLQALETVEADLWLQYSELGGTQDNEVSGPGQAGNPNYTAALTILDGDMPQYIHDNTDDEISHEAFLSNYLKSKGAEPFDLTPFKVLPSSQADGADKTAARLTNLTQLTIDTSFWSRYRSITNPDFDPGAPFVQAVPSLNVGQHTAIPRTNDDTAGSNPSNPPSSISTHLQAIAFTAGFHFAFIEQGGASLYPSLAFKAADAEVLRILVSIGGVEIDHFGLWHDKAGNAVNAPLAGVTDPETGLTFPNLNNPATELTQTNLILPEPCGFISKSLPPCSVIRPTLTQNAGAVATIKAFTDDLLFLGQTPAFFNLVNRLAVEADSVRRGF